MSPVSLLRLVTFRNRVIPSKHRKRSSLVATSKTITSRTQVIASQVLVRVSISRPQREADSEAPDPSRGAAVQRLVRGAHPLQEDSTIQSAGMRPSFTLKRVVKI